jgi:hypothetical protein
MYKATSLAILSLLLTISAVSQTSREHFNLGMTIDEFAARFDLAHRTALEGTEANSLEVAAHAALRGERSVIQTSVRGAKMAFLFDDYTLREVEITAGNTFEHELQVLTESLGEPSLSKTGSATWDRSDGTRFTLISRQGTGTLLVAPTPSPDR